MSEPSPPVRFGSLRVTWGLWQDDGNDPDLWSDAPHLSVKVYARVRVGRRWLQTFTRGSIDLGDDLRPEVISSHIAQQATAGAQRLSDQMGVPLEVPDPFTWQLRFAPTEGLEQIADQVTAILKGTT